VKKARSASDIARWPGAAVAFCNVPGLQLHVVRQADPARAGRAWAGGLIVSRLGLMATPWIGAPVVLDALDGRLDRAATRSASMARRVATAAQ
jgi:hypothetical protein